jgi:hypothetical protein
LRHFLGASLSVGAAVILTVIRDGGVGCGQHLMRPYITLFIHAQPDSHATKPMTAPMSVPADRRLRHASAPAIAPRTRPGLPNSSVSSMRL